MNHPIEEAHLALPRPPYVRGSLDFSWRDTPFAAGIHAGSQSCTPEEAIARLRELADYIERNTK